MPVTFLELENFKSYAGVQRIGPFKDFTSIIGPNGSGKSNLMDAISFVFGVQSRDLRSSQMKDLIFRPPGKIQSINRLKARASLYYEDEEETGKQTIFSRTISPNGIGEYQVNGTSKTFKEYEQALAEIGVLLKARNFLVFQGDVESIAHKSPKELVELLEQISSSAELKDDYQRLSKEKEQAEAATLFAYNKQKGLKSERRVVKEQKEEAERFHQVLEKKNLVKTEMYLWQLYHLHQAISEKEETIAELQQQVDELEEQENQSQLMLKEAKKMASTCRRENATFDKKRIALASQVTKLEPSVIQVDEEIKSLKKKIESEKKQLIKYQRDATIHDETLESLRKDIEEYKETQAQLDKDYEDVKQSASDIILTEEQEVEYERVRELAAAASDEPLRVLKALTRKLEAARSKAGGLTESIDSLQNTRDETARDITALEERKETLASVRAVS
jgi:structural maintenance of chromosome 1